MVKLERCKFASKRLSFYLDGQLSDKGKMIVEKHLLKCKYCQKEIILLRNARLIVRSFSAVKLPSTLDRRFSNILHQRAIIR